MEEEKQDMTFTPSMLAAHKKATRLQLKKEMIERIKNEKHNEVYDEKTAGHNEAIDKIINLINEI